MRVPLRGKARWKKIALVIVALVLADILHDELTRPYERWPLPEEFTRDGSGRLADIIPGDWEVICYVAYYHGMPEQVRTGLRDANLSEDYAKGVPEFYLSDNRFALVLLKANQRPRILALGQGALSYYPRGDRCQPRERADYRVTTLESYYGGQYIVIDLTGEEPNPS